MDADARAAGDPRANLLPPTVAVAGDPRGKAATWTLIGSTPAGTCSQCAVAHEPAQPHDQRSLRWQYVFFAEHDRWPTWADAMAHCSDETYEEWRRALADFGVTVEPRRAEP